MVSLTPHWSPTGWFQNGSRRLGVWPAREQFGVVYLWHDLEGRQPTWEPPDIFTDTGPHTAGLDYHPASPHGLIRYGALPLHPQLVLENAADPMHFRYVHGTKNHPVFLRRWEDDARWFSRIGFGARWREMDPDSHDGDTPEVLRSRMVDATAQLPNDIEIWSHQRFEDPPALATVDGQAFSDLRRWAKSFYPEVAAASRL